MTDHNENPPCAFCRRLRFIAMMFVMIMGLALSRPELSFLRGIDLTLVAAYGFGAVFVVLLLWKAYQEWGAKDHDEFSEPNP